MHHELYSLPAIQAAGEAFSGVATVQVQEQMPYFDVTLEPIPADDESSDALTGEFANYVLGLTVEEKRAGA